MAPPLPVLLMTRPERDSRRFIDALRGARAPDFAPVISPLIGIAPTGPLPDMAGRQPVFTSANGVRAFTALGGKGAGPCYTVGAATARVARDAGFEPRSAGGNADDLVALILRDAPGVPLVHLHGTHARGRVADRLRADGLAAEGAAIYDQPALPLTDAARAALAADVPVVAPLFSPRSAALFGDLSPGAAPLIVAAMSDEVSAALGGLYSERLVTARRPDGQAMAEAVAEALKMAQKLVDPRGSVKG
ncbi:uroporphyrinogen-III synthase [Salipiger mucosus]|uniref:Uroporphyrinogen-III synthase n=1 Tax=Salipiger mucosus DSM 16094 TaxID=1123237 RepID=S9S8D5_9RHOB|nr:uroporphyrinogen-III synthase [Salipiger mucosus]EPX82509.1 Uroporphyrinogen-III synthase [Salipiger mucosus DSM 16094]